MATKSAISELRELAKLQFITTTITAQQLASNLKVTPKTIGNWRRDDNWDALREANNTKPQLLIQKYIAAMAAITAKVEEEGRAYTPSELDSLSKLSKMVKDLRQSHTPQQAMEIMNEFMNYTAMSDLPLSKKLVPLAHAFVIKKFKDVR